MAESQPPEENSTPAMENTSPRIIVQGGAYSRMWGNLAGEYKKVAKQSARKGYQILKNNGTAVEAVEAAVIVFEDSPRFNAGCGSYLSNDDEVECDAMIMEGHTLRSGAVIGGRKFRNPVSLSKLIMTDSKHCALSASGALQFAEEKGFPTCDPEELKSPYAVKIAHSGYQEYVNHHYLGKPLQEQEQPIRDREFEEYVLLAGVPQTHDTVSAVAMDTSGHFACALSTGGIAGKLKGRVGDAPLIGCGGYANGTGAATVTGVGESIMKLTLGREVIYNMEKGQNAQLASINALEKLRAFDNGRGGVIAIDKNGHFGMSFNTEKMVWASIKDNTLQFGLEEGEIHTEQP